MQQGKKKSKKKKLTDTLNRFFLLHEAVICFSICLVCVPSIFVHPHWGDGSDLHFFFFLLYLFPRSCVRNRFPNQSCILGERLSSASNENKCGMLNLKRDRYSSATCIHGMRHAPTVKSNMHFWVQTYDANLLAVFGGMWLFFFFY